MKKISVIIITLAAIAWAGDLHGQHYIGVRGGYGGGLGRFYPSVSGQTGSLRQNQKMVFGLWSGGVAWKYYSPERYIGGVGAELEFLQRGFEFHMYSRDSDVTYRRTVNSINVPLIWQPHLNMIGNRLRIFVNLGINVSYNIDSHEYVLVKGEGIVYQRPYDMKLNRDNPFGFGLQGGFGFNVVFGRVEFMAEARYYFSYGDIYRNRSKYYGDNDPDGIFAHIANIVDLADPRFYNPIRSPIDNLTVSVGFFYRLGKDSAPKLSLKALQKQAERVAQREARQYQKEQEKKEKNGKHEAAESSEADTEGYQRDIQPGNGGTLPGGDGNGDGGEGQS